VRLVLQQEKKLKQQRYTAANKKLCAEIVGTLELEF
jgi:hypothetical protein